MNSNKQPRLVLMTPAGAAERNRNARVQTGGRLRMATIQATRPASWQTKDCPTWCTVEHDDRDLPGSRECVSAARATAQSLEPTLLVSTEGDGTWKLNEVHLALEQGVLDAAPRMSMSWGDGTVRTFTLEEIEQLTADAAQLLALARSATTAPGHSVAEVA